MSVSLLAAFLLGLASSLHCVLMCGGIACALSAVHASNPLKHFLNILLYNFGRITLYAVLGAFSGLISALFFKDILLAHNMFLRIIVAVILIVSGLYVSKLWLGLSFLEQYGAKLWRKISPITKKLFPITKSYQVLLLGLLWGMMPCAMVYGALALAMTTGGATRGGLIMLSFGLGTLPAMLLTAQLLQFLKSKFYTAKLNILNGMVLICLGVWILSQV